MRTRNVCALMVMGATMAATAALGVRGERAAGAAPEKPGAAEACPVTQQAKLRAILRQLHAMNQREIDAAKLAPERARSQQVKDFASEMQRDHQVDDDKLQDLARRRGVSLVEAVPIDPIHAATDAALSVRVPLLKDREGSAFDALYLGPQVLVHEMALQAIDRGLKLAPQKGAEHDLLEQTKVSVTMHRDHALRLASQLLLPPIGIGGGATETGEPSREPSTGGGPSGPPLRAAKDAGVTSARDAQVEKPEAAPPHGHEQGEPGIHDHVEAPGE